jgi:hypothetical protein
MSVSFGLSALHLKNWQIPVFITVVGLVAGVSESTKIEGILNRCGLFGWFICTALWQRISHALQITVLPTNLSSSLPAETFTCAEPYAKSSFLSWG